MNDATAEREGSGDSRREASPLISVVVAAYNSRKRIHLALDSLRTQDIDGSYEVIVVDSGSDGCADFVAATHPEARLVRSAGRLYPGAAWNAGIRAARGRYIAFLADDCVARRDWLQRRVAKHRQGFDVVAGAVTNGTPFHPLGSADYYLEYSAQIPSQGILEEQAIPHVISCERTVFERVGLYAEHLLAGSDTLFGARLRHEGVTVGFDADVRIAHKNLTRLGPYLRHQYEHGRGLAQMFAEPAPGMWRPRLAPHEEPRRTAARRMFLVYPRRRWRASARRIARGRPSWLPGYLLLTPLVWAGLYAAALGQWTEWRAIRSAGSEATNRHDSKLSR
jgi:glycosyltransferase involved in cell wall biosynthesis